MRNHGVDNNELPDFMKEKFMESVLTIEDAQNRLMAPLHEQLEANGPISSRQAHICGRSSLFIGSDYETRIFSL